MIKSVLVWVVSICIWLPIQAAEVAGAKVDWLDQVAPALNSGVSFGVPWPRGAVQKGESLHLVDGQGQSIPAQTWPLAYWPDGSMKWTGHAIIVPAGANGPFTVEPGNVAAPKSPIKVEQTDDDGDDRHRRDSARRFEKSGSTIISSISIGPQADRCQRNAGLHSRRSLGLRHASHDP